LAAVSAVAGAVAMLAACKFRRPRGSGKKPCACGKTPAAKREERPFEKRKPHPAPADGSVEIYVGNLSYDLTEDLLRKEFEAYGKVNSVRVVTHRQTGRSKGFGFVHMPDRAEAENAVKHLNDKDILGRKLRCNEAKNLI
jgi:RNA recognition motif-containing protein